MALANTVSLETDLSVSPYYDDFNESKQFHRILFRPGLAVQARELTQLQTILQNQVDRFGEHVFKEGSVVTGCELNYQTEANYVKIKDLNVSNNEVTPGDFEGTQVTGNTSGVVGYIIDSVTGTEAGAPDTKALYVRYTSAGSNNTSTTFVNDEVLNSNTGLSANTLTANSIGTGSRVTYGEGIIFSKDHFIYTPEQTVIVGKFSANVDVRIGYDVQESIITPSEDSTLNDPARGAFNFNAPGATRLKLNPVLTTRTYNPADDTDENFIELLRIRNGEPEFRSDKPDYAKINDYLARRTYEESGNYVVDGLNLRLREHLRQSNNGGVFTQSNGGNNELLSVDVSSGVSYVFGFRQENLTTQHVAVDKGIDFNSIEQATTSTNYGNYVTVNEVSGNFNVNEQFTVSLRDEALNAISNGDFSNTATTGVGNEIGTARVKSLEYRSGTPGTAAGEFDLYLYDIAMSNGTFSQVRSIFSSDPTSDTKADPVLVSNSAVLNETNFNTSVFKIPAASIKTIRDVNGNIDTTFQFLKSFDVSIDTNGQFTVATGEADEQYPFGTGALNDTQKLENFDVVLNEAVDEYKRGERIDMTRAGASITIDTTTSASFDIGDTLSSTTSATVITRLNKVDGQETAKVFNADRYVRINVANNAGGTSGPWNLGFSDVFSIEEVRLDSSAFSSATQGSDVTDDFKLDTGQKDNFYGHGRLKKKSFSDLTIGASDHLLVKLSYFTHDTSQGVGYLSVDSYPIDDDNAANTNAITTQEIPIFTSPVTGDSIDLREAIDIRPRVTDTASDSTTVTGSTTDPTTSSSFDIPSGGLHYSPPNEDFLTDLDYYLPRIDRIVIDRQGKFRATRGTSSKNPGNPPEPSDGMTIALVDIAPYPSITPKEANDLNRLDLSTKLKPKKVKNYTMEEIGVLDDRIENLEYYTSLSLLENDAKSFSVADSQGLDRFKNGILVDNFEGGQVADLDNDDFVASFDQEKKELRPPFQAHQIEMAFNSSLSSNFQLGPKDEVLTVSSSTDKFTEGETITQGGTSGTFRYKVDNKVYVEDVSSGPFTTGTITGGTSGDTDTVTSVKDLANGKFATLPWTHDLVLEQPVATGTRNIAGLLYTWFGELELTPQEDIWIDTEQAPDVNINRRQTNDIWLPTETRRVLRPGGGRRWGWGGGWGGGWGWWNWRQRGRRTRTSVDTISRDVDVTTETTTDVIGTEVIPFMRSRVVDFEATSLKPNSRFYAFFDGEDVNDYVRPTDSSFANTDSYGSALIADGDGKLYGQFRIPNNNADRFQTGTLPFRLTDSATDSRETGRFTSFAESDYTASGTKRIVQDTVITTRTITRTRQRTRTTTVNTIGAGGGGGGGGGGGDPVAQTFRVNDRAKNPDGTSGVFLTKLDVYFQTKDDTQPLIVELREVDPSSGYVTNNIIPFSRTIVESSDVNTSTDGSSPTPVFFNTPIFLETDTDYAVVLKPGGDNPNYRTFIARLGETDLVTGTRMGVNPFTGALFVSSNDRVWTAIQEEDLKFRAYFAEFNTNASGSVVFINEDREFLQVNSTPNPFDDVGEAVHGETTLTMNAAPTANVGEFASGDTSGANGEITLVSGSDVRVKDVTLASKYSNGETITYFFANGTTTGETSILNSQSTPTGEVFYYSNFGTTGLLEVSSPSGTFVANTQIKSQTDGTTGTIELVTDRPIDSLTPSVSKLDVNDTSIGVSAKLATSDSSRDSNFINYKEEEDNIPSARRFILGAQQESSGLSGDASAELKLTISNGDNNRHSPAIDLEKTGLTIAENFINNLSNTASETTTSGGDAITRYITKTVTLAEGQDAEDIRVILAAYRPSTADVRVYYKILAQDDSDDIEDKSWVEMDKVALSTSFSDTENIEDFIDYEFEIPSAQLTGPNNEVQYSDGGVTYTGFKHYKIKIVLESSSTVNPPRARSLRTIALQA